jgi:MTH538 TIR-like domain (DUF1863)
MKNPNIFISHRWSHKQDYYNLSSKFDERGFYHYDYSVPKHDPLDVNRKKLIEGALKEQVRQCNFFIVIARMASGNSYWIKREIQYAKEYGKPIMAVIPFDYFGNIPLSIQNAHNVTDSPIRLNTPYIIRIIEAFM